MNLRQRIKLTLKTFLAKRTNQSDRKKYKKMASEALSKRSDSILKVAATIFHRLYMLFIRFIMIRIYGVKGKKMLPINDLTLLESASSLALKIRTGKITSLQVLKSFIVRINEVNPLLNCVVDNRFDEALKDAIAADKLIASKTHDLDYLEREKPFLGVPISTKDCIAVKGMLQTAGLYKRRTYRAPEDSDAMALMREAGAIPFALTNISECCMWWESANPVHGRTNNPYDSTRIVGGSSGGEGCLQGAGGSPFGIGSDIGGSIRMPAYFNGVYGHKPSKFIVSNKGQFPLPFSEEQNSFLGIGPMCRYPIDLKPVLKIISGKNAPLLKLDEPVNVKDLNVFYQFNDGGGHLISVVHPDIRNAMEKVVKHLKSTFSKKPIEVHLEQMRNSAPIWFGNMKDPNGTDFDSQLNNLEGPINCWIELAKWCFGCSHHTFIGIMTGIIEKNGVKYGSPKHAYLVQQRDNLLREMKDMLGDNGVFLYPTHPTPAPYHNEPLSMPLNFSYTGIINVLGLPATAVPLGLGSEGLPIGLQVVANVNNDRLCLAMACELDRAFGGWVAPEITA